MLKIQNITKKFGGVKAVDNCDFEIKKGMITALIGPNGSGKTTLFNLVSGILKADSGKIILNNKNITNLSIEKISNLGISRLFQKPSLFKNLTIKENLLLAMNDEDTKFWQAVFKISSDKKDKFEEKIKQILKNFEMEDFINIRAEDLSYGQKRLVEIARAILNQHNFLMLDEPAAGVNPRLREKIRKILLKLKEKNETILLIEHDMNFTLKTADTIIVLEKGGVIAQGNPEEIKNNKRVLEAYLGG
ncbi:ABC transporter ATP-binding protein [Candidatus Parcubacteria bacterium]|nr:ABC transporter ATP-binding protein [Candidatus Parcubacteria bacterium]